ncbi:MAG TPA: hypothetical protein DCL57_03940, partial [Microbacterium sp.]|nr:hypothetical protein [Microbacterium sp.]
VGRRLDLSARALAGVGLCSSYRLLFAFTSHVPSLRIGRRWPSALSASSLVLLGCLLFALRVSAEARPRVGARARLAALREWSRRS